ncbi:HD domain-containing protein [Saccharibacillus sp. CPCC 101409]|uniref:HD-GYP domain-containing protein n=1 Tax=Saccharibacillus sp. CPCC 101409 TaxID=3058041 RepID=UPI002671D751|nr:HD domain-containing phosphohydrolase [Saccharibacillus sp. CPCC 101409]MDO3410844.1 HD domain-containing protein [Saccharibacillus sp. CPCC 101409]
MRVHVTELQHGDMLREDAFNPIGLHVLPRGTVIKTEETDLLNRHRIDYVEIEPRGGDTGAGVLSRAMQSHIELAIRGYQSIFLEALTSGKFDEETVDMQLEPLLRAVDDHRDIVSLLLVLEREDVSLYNHSMQVGMLSYYIATWLGYSRGECYAISKCGYLHDIGKSKISPTIRNRTDNLTEYDRQELRKHAKLGYDVILKSMEDKVTALVAWQHHEREDGTGYPQGLTKPDIHPYAQIVAVADTYLRLSEGRKDAPKRALLDVLHEVYELGFGKLNEKPVQALVQHLMSNLIGKSVRLNNGETGTIILNNPSDIFKPLVRVDDQFRDLSRERGLAVEEVFV